MKTLRFMAIIIAGSCAVNMHADFYQNMQNARMAAQQRVQSGIATLKSPQFRANAMQRAENFKQWAKKHRKEIIAATVAIAALTATIIGGKKFFKGENYKILNAFRANGVDVEHDTRYYLEIGKLAKSGGMNAINKHLKENPSYKVTYDKFSKIDGFTTTVNGLARSADLNKTLSSKVF